LRVLGCVRSMLLWISLRTGLAFSTPVKHQVFATGLNFQFRTLETSVKNLCFSPSKLWRLMLQSLAPAHAQCELQSIHACQKRSYGGSTYVCSGKRSPAATLDLNHPLSCSVSSSGRYLVWNAMFSLLSHCNQPRHSRPLPSFSLK